MKKILLIIALLATSLAVSANSIRYFTYSQAERTIRHLDAQPELMIYCGYEDEIETYVLVNEVWAEKINSQYYEIWLYGYDAYTGDEIYMPIDLGCIWLYNRTGTRMYSAATTLRFRNARPMPTFIWAMPPYNPFARRHHAPGFLYTYHYDIHQPGWHHPHHGNNPHNYPPFYMRHRSEPAPVHHEPFTPGTNQPRTMTPDGHGYLGNTRGGNPTTTVGNPAQMATSSSASIRRTTGNTANPNTIQVRKSTNTNSSTNTSTRTATPTNGASRSAGTVSSPSSSRSGSSNSSDINRSSSSNSRGTSSSPAASSTQSRSGNSSASTTSSSSTRSSAASSAGSSSSSSRSAATSSSSSSRGTSSSTTSRSSSSTNNSATRSSNSSSNSRTTTRR